jgi:broad specificity phosphatase PhoE
MFPDQDQAHAPHDRIDLAPFLCFAFFRTMKRIYLIRHGETDWNQDLRLMGRLDIPLNEKGKAQMRALAPMLDGCGATRIHASPVLRTVQSADILAESLGLETLHEPRLREMEFGKWEGRPYGELMTLPEFRAYFARPAETRIPDVEDLKSVQARAVDFMRALWTDEADAAVAVTHADIIRTILAHTLRMDLNAYLRISVDNGSLTLLEKSMAGTSVKALNALPPGV